MPANKKQNSPVPTEQEVADWKQFYGGLSEEDKSILETETKALHDHLRHSSKFNVARNFAKVREVLAPNREDNAATKKHWSLYLKVNHFYGVSRATGYRLMDAYSAAKELFSEAFLDALAASGNALGLNPSVASPLGKFTKAAQKFDQLKPGSNLSTDEAADLVTQVMIAWQKDKVAPEEKGRAEREVAFGEAALRHVKRLAKKFMTFPEEPTPAEVLEELERVVAHLYHEAGQQGEVTIEPKRIVVHKKRTSAPDAALRTPKVKRNQVAAAAKKPTKQGAKMPGIFAASEKATPEAAPPSAGGTHEGGVPRKPPVSMKVADVSPFEDAPPIALAHAASVADAMVDSALRKHGWPTDDREDDAGTSPQGIDGRSGADESGLQTASGRG